MTTVAELRERNKLAQRRRRSKAASKEVDRDYMRRKRADPEFCAAESMALQVARRCPDTWAREVLRSIRSRARKRGLEFSLTEADIQMPEVCPALGIPIFLGEPGVSALWSPNSPSVDRLDSSKGYTPDNVRVISMRANLLKKDATAAEVRGILAYMERESVS